MFVIRRLFVVSLFLLIVVMPVAALDLSSTPASSPAAPHTLTVIFGAQEPVFDQALAPSMSDVSVVSPSAAMSDTPASVVPAVPEPSTLGLVGLGVLILLGVARRKHNE